MCVKYNHFHQVTQLTKLCLVYRALTYVDSNRDHHEAGCWTECCFLAFLFVVPLQIQPWVQRDQLDPASTEQIMKDYRF